MLVYIGHGSLVYGLIFFSAHCYTLILRIGVRGIICMANLSFDNLRD